MESSDYYIEQREKGGEREKKRGRGVAEATERAVEWFGIAGGKGKERNERERERNKEEKKKGNKKKAGTAGRRELYLLFCPI